MVDPLRCRQFQEVLKTLPMPCWTTHVNDHVDIWQENVLALAKQFFTKDKSEKTRPRLSESILSLIQLKRSALDYGRANNQMQDLHFKNELRSLEKAVRAAVREDQRAFYEGVVNNLKAAGVCMTSKSSIGCSPDLGRPAHKSGQRRPLPLLKNKEGQPV